MMSDWRCTSCKELPYAHENSKSGLLTQATTKLREKRKKKLPRCQGYKNQKGFKL